MRLAAALRLARQLHTSCCIRASTTAAPPAGAGDRKKYSHTLLLPQTSFPLKHSPAREEQVRRKTTVDLYRLQRERSDSEFTLHDGPPYANGSLHMGHALNRTLKDIINRHKLLTGHRINYKPGWDCHGLPIEQKALKQLGVSHTAMQPMAIREVARKCAKEAIELQRSQMIALGVLADWDDYYTTMYYEVRQLRLFQRLAEKGLISYRLRPVFYSPSSRTALAEAELDYQDIESRSVYVAFKVVDSDLELLIWTTTPWTLPANMGVCVGDMPYVVARMGERKVVIAKDRVEALGAIMDLEVVEEISGADLIGKRYSHRFSDQTHPVIASDHVTADSGTGLVHSAPAHGHEDYEAFVRAGLQGELRCPVDDEGKFTRDVGADSLVGKHAFRAVGDIISMLEADGSLITEQKYQHRYPHDWKTKEPVMVRATPQWFLTTDKSSALAALENVAFHPPQSRARLEAFVQSRSEWCISRQRSWGVPIPVLFRDGQPALDTIPLVIDALESRGTDAWWSELDLFPAEYTRGADTLDVWFDSGSSWTMLSAPADIYLEGSDQHRGWFQSSLLTRVEDTGTAPYRNLITHGFITDETGKKMSKSAGNGISPEEIISKHGTDVLRLWAASVDFTRDVSIGKSAIAQAGETLRKIRSSMRFAMSQQGEGGGELGRIDRHVIQELGNLRADCLKHYEAFAFSRVVVDVTRFLSTLTWYYDTVKDRLYCNAETDASRRAVVFHSVTRIVAPIVPHLAEELWAAAGHEGSIFLAHRESRTVDHVDVSQLLELRSAFASLLEEARQAHAVRSSAALDAALSVADPELETLLDVAAIRAESELSTTWQMSKVIQTASCLLKLTIAPARGAECPRCWRHTASQTGDLCARCNDAVT